MCADVGLDDNWQKCGKYGADGLTYHDEEGNPIINTDTFPNMKDMTDHAHGLGLTAGWYGGSLVVCMSTYSSRGPADNENTLGEIRKDVAEKCAPAQHADQMDAQATTVSAPITRLEIASSTRET